MNPLAQIEKTTSIFIAVTLVCLALSRSLHAVSPPPDGGYPNQNTAEGTNALLNLTTGTGNTALGFDALAVNTTGTNNTATGSLALVSNTFGFDNTAIGTGALQANTSGATNTATGYYALFHNTIGDDNTANGRFAMAFNTVGGQNTAIGESALASNTTAYNNTAVGFLALQANTTGTQNTATGTFALDQNATANNNTADGTFALYLNTTGTQNTATGAFALQNNTTADNNTADGFQALLSNTTGTQNTATGESALKNNTTANKNTADGFQVLFHNSIGAGNAGVGYHALYNNNGSSNIALGSNAGANLTTGNNNIDIGNQGVAAEANTIRVGGPQTRTFIKGISGVAVSGAAVVVNGAGQLGVAASSKRFKDGIKPMDKASEAILSLEPVTFRYKKALDPDRLPQFGLIAEDVAKVNPNLVARDHKGQVYTVRYDAVNAMLLNEFLKEHKKVEQQSREIQIQKDTISKLKKGMDSVIAQLKDQTSQIQKVNARLELSKGATQSVAVKN